ncbi:MAG: hypothetical protein KDH88_06260 [Chromatiales bacterium]|nr:hypothetical protein [Chromatiales bacterium]
MLVLGVSAPSAVQAAGSYKATVQYPDGTRATLPVDEFRIAVDGEEPTAALILPAIQAAREAARRMQSSKQKGAVLPLVTIEGSDSSGVPIAVIDLTDVIISSYSLRGVPGESMPLLDFSLGYTKVTARYDQFDTFTYDCREGACKFVDKYAR